MQGFGFTFHAVVHTLNLLHRIPAPIIIAMRAKKSNRIAGHFLVWYDSHQRDLPWRQADDPYRIWVAEVMLQQTQVDTVIPYYHRFLEQFPTVQALAGASLGEVLKVWEGMGYYARARNLHAAAKLIIEELDGEIPKAWEELLRLPGIGPYTAGAILSIAFGQRVPAIDGNARRVLSRLFAIESPIDQAGTQRRLRELARELVPAEDPGRFNQALMDLGATICRSQKPACRLCPVSDLCEAYQQGLQEAVPVTRKRGPVSHYDVTAAVIGMALARLLIAQRPLDGLLGGLWEFPGGKQEPGESLELCLRREIQVEKNLILPSKTTDLAPQVPKRDKASLTIRHADSSLERFLLPTEMIDEFRRSLPVEDMIVTMVPPLSLMGNQPPKREPEPASDSGDSGPMPFPPPTPVVP